MRILIVEDELRMASLIRRGLVNEGLAADVAGNQTDVVHYEALEPRCLAADSVGAFLKLGDCIVTDLV